jgi:hypothetical protein
VYLDGFKLHHYIPPPWLDLILSHAPTGRNVSMLTHATLTLSLN